MTSKDRIQHMLITHLLREGSIRLSLPDGMNLEIGITSEGKDGTMQKTDRYCWAMMEQDDREVSMDSFNLALRIPGDSDKIICDDTIEEELRPVRILSVI